MDKFLTDLIEKYYPRQSLSYHIYYTHCRAVTDLALRIAKAKPDLAIDLDYIEYAGMLHDIGIYLTNAPEIECYGELPYIMHGFKGRELLEKAGLADIAPVCERHIGVGISIGDIVNNKLPLPHRDMTPQTTGEKLICYADKFYSKSAKDLLKPKSMEKIHKSIIKYGEDKWAQFLLMQDMFGLADGFHN
jgi:uncharacterized protein